MFYLSTRAIGSQFNYTARIGLSFLHGRLGLLETPPSWLNEFVPVGSHWYSVFPLGSILSIFPVAWIAPHLLCALIAGVSVYYFCGIAHDRILLGLFPIFGTWTWTNLGIGGAWQIALGFAMLGQAGGLYYTLRARHLFVAGVFLALSVGNRTEMVLTAPFFLLFWRSWKPLIPLAVLLLATGLYNYARFGSFFDFGYMRIPHIREEHWYRHGLFSFQSIPYNAHAMLFQGMEWQNVFPFLLMPRFGCSIFLASPFLCLMFRERGEHRLMAWCVIGLVTLVLWCHGNSGGWQFSYRYAMELLPWMLLLLWREEASVTELTLFGLSLCINAVAVSQFLWRS